MTDVITRELHLDLTPEQAWPTISESERLREWLAEEVELELAPAGDACFTVDGELRTGWVEEVSPPTDGRSGRLVFWWQAAEDPASRVVLELVADRAGSRLTVSETRPLERLQLLEEPQADGGSAWNGPALLHA